MIIKEKKTYCSQHCSKRKALFGAVREILWSLPTKREAIKDTRRTEKETISRRECTREHASVNNVREN